MAGAIPSTMSSKEQLKFRRAGGLDKKYNQELVAVLTDDLSTASNSLSVTAEAVSFSAGAAGTTGVVTVDKAPIYNADGGKIGFKDDTSFAWVTGAVLTTEVDYDASLSDTAFLATLSNGEFAVDYLLGRVFYKKATTGTSDTCNYKTRQLNVEATSAGVGEDVNVKQAGSVLPATHRNPQDFTVAYTSNVTVTVTGAPFTVADANCRIAYIYYRPSGGDWQSPLVNGVNGVSLTSTADVITVAGAGTPFAASDEYLVGIIYQDKNHTASTNSERVEEINPLNQQVVEGSLVDTTDVAAATNYYPSADGMQMLGAKDLSLTGKLIDADGTMTLELEVTNDEDATAANRDWISAGLAGIDMKTGVQVLAAALTVTNGTLTFGVKYPDLNFKYARVVMTNDGATNTAIIKVRRMY